MLNIYDKIKATPEYQEAYKLAVERAVNILVTTNIEEKRALGGLDEIIDQAILEVVSKDLKYTVVQGSILHPTTIQTVLYHNAAWIRLDAVIEASDRQLREKSK